MEKLVTDVNELYKLVKDFFGYKLSDIGRKNQECEVYGTLYEAINFSCGIDLNYHNFYGIGIENPPEGVITTFLGKKATLDATRENILDSLAMVDRYCRLRLPDKYLEAYDEAYAERGRAWLYKSKYDV